MANAKENKGLDLKEVKAEFENISQELRQAAKQVSQELEEGQEKMDKLREKIIAKKKELQDRENKASSTDSGKK